MRDDTEAQIWLFIYFLMHYIFVAAHVAFSGCGQWGLLSSCGTHFLIMVTSLVEYGLLAHGLQ